MESAIWAYPWDLLDEGVDTVLGRLADAGIGAVSVAAAYHNVRALCPHNPRRAVVHGEGGVVYFAPDPAAVSELRIQPVVSEMARERDPLAEICEAAARRGVRVHAWLVLHHNSRLGGQHPHATVENAFGDRYPFGLCPANPDVRALTVALVRMLAARPEIDSLELESLGYMGLEHTGHHSKTGLEMDDLHRWLLSLCFCPHCAARMEAQGVEAGAARRRVQGEVRAYFDGRFQQPNDDLHAGLAAVLGQEWADGILAARDDAVLSLLEELYWLVRGPQKLCLMVAGSPFATGAGAGVTLSLARQWCDRLLCQAFHRDPPVIRAALAEVAVRRGSTPLYAGLQAIPPAARSADDLDLAVLAARDAGVEGIQFYHYGIMPLRNLDWIRSALAGL